MTHLGKLCPVTDTIIYFEISAKAGSDRPSQLNEPLLIGRLVSFFSMSRRRHRKPTPTRRSKPLTAKEIKTRARYLSAWGWSFGGQMN
jgi:hypothetical protein